MISRPKVTARYGGSGPMQSLGLTSWTAGNVPIFTATGLADSGVSLVSTMAANTVWCNPTAGTAAPQASTVLTLGNGTAAAPIYSFTASSGTGMYLQAAGEGALTAAGKKAFVWRNTDSTSFFEYIFSSGVFLRSAGGTNVDFNIASNGTGEVLMRSNGGSTNGILFRATGPATAGGANNYLRVKVGDGAGNGPELTAVAQGTGDTDIDLKFTPIGAGKVRFGTHAALSGETVTGYITIKDSGGTSRKLAVVS